MKKFAFSLERMLSYKHSLYEKERNELARLRHERLSAEHHRDSVLHQVAEKEMALYRDMEKGLPVSEVKKMGYYRDNADTLVQVLETQMQELDIEIEKQLAIVIALDQDVQSLEKLREKQWDEYQAETRREEAERISELVGQKYIENQKIEEQENNAVS